MNLFNKFDLSKPENSLDRSTNDHAAAAKKMDSAAAHLKKETSSTGIQERIRTCLLFFTALLYWEILLRIVTERLTLTLYPLPFLAALSLVFSLLTGWFKKGLNHACTLVILTVLTIYYGAQLVYFRIFGSMFSVSMIGMGGDAITDFSAAMFYAIKKALGWIAVFCIPLLSYAAVLIFKRPAFPRHRFAVQAVTLAAALCFWGLAVAALSAGGTGRYTAHDAYFNRHTGTDISSRHLGVLTTTIIEAFGGVRGGTDSDTEILSVSSAERPVIEFAENESGSTTGNADYGVENNTGNTSQNESALPENPPAPPPEPNIIEEIDFAQLASMTDDEDIRALCQYFASVEPTYKNEYTGMLEGYNLICICAEAFSSAAIHPILTPTLYMMANNGIVLENYYNSFINTTTNGEFAFMTGLWPDLSRKADGGNYSGTFSQSSNNFMPYGLGNILAGEGYNSYMFHNYMGYYYNRASSHSNLGYNCKFKDDGLVFYTSWPFSDLEMVEQSVDDFIDNDRFNVYYMTYSAHGPYSSVNLTGYRNLNAVYAMPGGRELSEEAKYYIAANIELEYAVQHLLQRLEEAGKANNTLIVLTGDHYPYFLSHDGYDELIGAPEDQTFGYYKSSCIMWCGSIEEPIICDSYCCNVDILPTVLNLMGIEYDSRLFAGRDVLADCDHAALLYDMSFITKEVKFDATLGEAHWAENIMPPDANIQQQYLDYTSELLTGRYVAALKLMDTDFYRFVWENSGLMPQEPDTGGAAAG